MKTVAVILNIFLLTAFIFLFVRGNFWNKTKNFLQEKRDVKNTYTYDMNRLYEVKKNMHMSYKDSARIVMLGNSLTEQAEWDELLHREDVVNRGISADITEGMLNRIETVLKVNPEICLFMGGINDIVKRVSYSKTVENIIEIVRILKENDIIPVIQSVIYVGRSYPDNERINTLVKKMNQDLMRIAADHGSIFIDLNKYLSRDGYLKKNYTYDGLHLNAKGYKKWSELLDRILPESIQ